MSEKEKPASSSAVAVSATVLDELDGRRAVTVAAYDNPVMAEMVKARLETEGFQVALADEHTVGIAGHLATAIGGVKVQVAEEDAYEAREVLNSMPDYAIDEDEDVGELVETSHELERKPLAETAPTAKRAFRAAVLGFFFPPLTLWSLYLAAKYARSSEEGGASRAGLAVVIDAMLFGLYALVFTQGF